MKKFFLTFAILGIMPTLVLGQSDSCLETNDIEGYQYLSKCSKSDSTYYYRYYFRSKEGIFVRIRSIDSKENLENNDKLFRSVENLIMKFKPLKRCELVQFTFSFLITSGGDLLDEVRIVRSDYKLKKIDRLKRKLTTLLRKEPIYLKKTSDENFTLVEFSCARYRMCTELREKKVLKYKSQ